MTRDEAVAKLRGVTSAHGAAISGRSIEVSLDGYVALGLLTLDEPDTVLGKFKRAIDGFGDLKSADAEALLGWIEDNGLKVVRADGGNA